VVDSFVSLRHVRMVAEEHGRPGLNRRPRQRARLGRGVRIELCAGVARDDDGVDHRTKGRNVRLHGRDVGKAGDVLVRGINRHVGCRVGQDTHLRSSLRVDDDRPASLGGVSADADAGWTTVCHVTKRALDAFGSEVVEMVVCEVDDVEACTAKRTADTRRTEAVRQASGFRPTNHRDGKLEVPEQHIAPAERFLYRPKTPHHVLGRLHPLTDGAAEHEVADGSQD
jgi:hypothetical protein